MRLYVHARCDESQRASAFFPINAGINGKWGACHWRSEMRSLWFFRPIRLYILSQLRDETARDQMSRLRAKCRYNLENLRTLRVAARTSRGATAACLITVDKIIHSPQNDERRKKLCARYLSGSVSQRSNHRQHVRRTSRSP